MSYKQKGGSQEFIILCRRGDLGAAQEYLRLNPDIDISAVNELAFRITCSEGHLDVAKWLLQVSRERGQDINISANNEFAFQHACAGGHLDVAKWLLQIKPTIDISAKNEAAFQYACEYKHLGVVKWLKTLNPKYEIIDEDTPNWRCSVLTNPKDIKWNKNKKLVALASQPGNIVGAMPTDLVRMTASYL